MENSPIGPIDYEKDEESDDDDDELKPSKNIFEAVFKGKEEIEESDQKEKLFVLEGLKGIDQNPELDSEAPVEELSEVETSEIAKSIAEERIEDIANEDPLDPENIASQTYLEDILESGDPDVAFRQATREILGDSEPEEETHQQEINPRPVILNSTNRIPIAPNTNRPIVSPNQAPNNNYDTNREVRRRTINVPRVVSGAALIDTLLYRRRARIENQDNKTESLKIKLSNDVINLSNKIIRQETILRQKVKLASQNETFKVERPIPNTDAPKENLRTETIPKTHKPEIIQIGRTVEKVAEKADEIVERPKTNLKLKRRELLLIASKVYIDGSNLRKIYENGSLSEKGLRRLVEVYLRGGNVKRALKRELLEKQLDFERDPAVRDQGALDEDFNNKSDNKIDNLLKERGIDFNDKVANIYPSSKKSSNLNNFSIDKPKTKIKFQDLLLILLIIILIVVIIVILFKNL